MIMELSKAIYSKMAVCRAAEAFQNIARITVRETDNYWSLEFSGCQYGETATSKEFENYLIDLENKPNADS
jgi:His-Xaa-Ser system protein HxsD